jgi:hypothetical protein
MESTSHQMLIGSIPMSFEGQWEFYTTSTRYWDKKGWRSLNNVRWSVNTWLTFGRYLICVSWPCPFDEQHPSGQSSLPAFRRWYPVAPAKRGTNKITLTRLFFHTNTRSTPRTVTNHRYESLFFSSLVSLLTSTNFVTKWLKWGSSASACNKKPSFVSDLYEVNMNLGWKRQSACFALPVAYSRGDT